MKRHTTILDLLKFLYPEYKWLPWKLKETPKGWWEVEDNRKEYITWLEEQLNIKLPEDWYNAPINKVYELYGRPFIQHYGSFQKAIMSIYPTLEMPWKIGHVDKWTKENQIAYLNWLEENLNIKYDFDWYKVKNQDIINLGGESFLSIFKGSIKTMLNTLKARNTWKGKNSIIFLVILIFL